MMRATLLALACLLTSGRAVHLIQLSAPAPHTESFQLTPNFIRNVLDMDVMNPAIVASPGAYRRVAPQQSVTYTRAIGRNVRKTYTLAEHGVRGGGGGSGEGGGAPLLRGNFACKCIYDTNRDTHIYIYLAPGGNTPCSATGHACKIY